MCALHCAQLLRTILHITDLIIFPLTLQTITIAPMMSIWGKGEWGSGGGAQQGSGAEPWWGGSGAKPPEAESFFSIWMSNRSGKIALFSVFDSVKRSYGSPVLQGNRQKGEGAASSAPHWIRYWNHIYRNYASGTRDSFWKTTVRVLWMFTLLK